ncbi:DNA ligase D [Roseivirga sp. BDSF3-8]|uniref:DNA ligase D n=1 Tax=Roseivirga sp. BDSF3-8 TaxID=3241598 RepID=UPI003531A24F
MADKDLLSKYRTKRDFSKTPEPAGEISSSAKDMHRFTVQRHQASRLHYDLRLEIEGVLKSWAVPKGPSMNPSDKRLAVATEDHPMKYLHFEGEIPEGQYGAGLMHVWDTGTFTATNAEGESNESALRKAYQKGDLKLTFEGSKLKGDFALVRTGREENHWLLIKKKDKYAASKEYDSEDHLSPAMALQQKKKKAANKDRQATEKLPEGKDKMPHEVKPMLATLHEGVFDDPEWLYEIKWDGYRAIAEVKEDDVKLYSRNGNSFLKSYPPLADALATLPGPLVVDGEIVVLNKNGVSSFQKLQNYEDEQDPNLYYYIFDVLFFNGYDLRGFALRERKKLLEQLAAVHERIRVSDHVEGNGEALLEEADKKGLEGIIAKRADSPYRTGSRSRDWLKIKLVKQMDAIIIGYTEPTGSRKHFGSLLLAVHDIDGELEYVGRVGTGFDEDTLEDLKKKLDRIGRKTCPVTPKPKTDRATYWVTPKLIAEVGYSERTDEGSLRHPVYKGLRKDKDPEEVVAEKSTPAQQTGEADELVKKLTSAKELKLQPEGREVSLSNLKKVYWRGEKEITKGALLAYYAQVAPYLLPHLEGRPQSLHRYPDGIEGKNFYHKDAGDLAPDWMKTYGVDSDSANKEICYLTISDLSGLLFTVNLGCIALNPWLSRTVAADMPDYCVIDLDPSEKNTFEEVIEVAQVIHSILEKAKIPCYPKTSGSTGIHILIPLGGSYTYEQSRDFARVICMIAMHQLPKLTSMERSPSKRKGKIYLDYLQNKKGATLACAYSVRPKPGAPVSAPLQWDEVKTGLKISDFTLFNMPDRLQKTGDLAAPVLQEGLDMGAAIDRLSELDTE